MTPLAKAFAKADKAVESSTTDPTAASAAAARLPDGAAVLQDGDRADQDGVG